MSLKTKEKILTSALDLFNSKGLAVVTTRRITLDINISQGHLTYYFRKRADILETLYGQFQDQVSLILAEPTQDQYHFGRLIKAILDIQYTYRFLFLDFAQVIRESETIKKEYTQLKILRKQKITDYLQVLKIKNTDIISLIDLEIEFRMMHQVLDKHNKIDVLDEVYKMIMGLLKA